MIECAYHGCLQSVSSSPFGIKDHRTRSLQQLCGVKNKITKLLLLCFSLMHVLIICATVMIHIFVSSIFWVCWKCLWQFIFGLAPIPFHGFGTELCWTWPDCCFRLMYKTCARVYLRQGATLVLFRSCFKNTFDKEWTLCVWSPECEGRPKEVSKTKPGQPWALQLQISFCPAWTILEKMIVKTGGLPRVVTRDESPLRGIQVTHSAWWPTPYTSCPCSGWVKMRKAATTF